MFCGKKDIGEECSRCLILPLGCGVNAGKPLLFLVSPFPHLQNGWCHWPPLQSVWGFVDGKYCLTALKDLFRNSFVKLPLKLIWLFLLLILQTLLSFLVGGGSLEEMLGIETKLFQVSIWISNCNLASPLFQKIAFLVVLCQLQASTWKAILGNFHLH